MKNAQEKVKLTVEETHEVAGGFGFSFNLASFSQPRMSTLKPTTASLKPVSTLKPVSSLQMASLKPVSMY